MPAQLISDLLSGDAAAAAHRCLSVRPGLSAFVGETTVEVTGTGHGGRNQHAALVFATALPNRRHAMTALMVGTDGRDGPTDAAGGLTDLATVERAKTRGVSTSTALADHDSNRALRAAGDLVWSGTTGTNVGDLWLVHNPDPPAVGHVVPAGYT